MIKKSHDFAKVKKGRCRLTIYQLRVTITVAALIFFSLPSFLYGDRGSEPSENSLTADEKAWLDRNPHIAREEAGYLFNNLEDRLGLSISDIISTYGDRIPGSQDEHIKKVSHLNRANPFLQTINYIDGSQRIRYVSPLEPNRRVIGLKIGLSGPKAALEDALSSGKPVLSSPFVIIQGKMGYSLMIPHAKEGAFELVFRAESVFGPESPFRMHQGIAIRIRDGHQTVYNSPDFREKKGLVLRTSQQMMGHNFQLEIIPGDLVGEKTLLVGSELDYPPFALVNKKGEAHGFSVDLFKAVAQVMGLKVRFRVGSWEEVRTALEKGEIDALPLVSYSEEREKVFDFTAPYTTSDAVAFIRKGDEGIVREKDLYGKRIIVMRADATHDYLFEQGITQDLLAVKSVAEALRLLASGEGDLAFLPRLTGLLEVKEMGLNNIVTRGPGFNVYGRGYGFAVREGNAELLEKLKLGLSIVKASGKYDELYDKWFGLVDPRGVSRETILKYTAIVSTGFLLVLTAALLWSWSLRREVKQRRFAEAELNRQRIFVEAVLENIQDGIVACDDEGLLALFNRASRTFHGIDVESLPPDEWASHYDLFLADGVTPMSTEEVPLYRAFRGERVKNQEMVITSREGTKRTVVASGQAMIDEKGRKLGAVVSMQDITDRRKVEGALKQSEQLLQMVIDTVPVVLVMKDRDGRHLLVNRNFEEVTGVKREAAIGKVDADIFPPHAAAKIREFDEKLIKEGKENFQEEEVPAPDGRVHTFYSRKVPVFDEENKVTGLVLASLDITEKKRVERELLIAKEEAEAANQAKSTFLANMSHELRTPLNAILGFSEMLGYDSHIKASQKEKLHIIRRSGEHLLDMINDVLDLSKIEAGKVEIENSPFDLHAMLSEIGQMFEIRAQSAGLLFNLDIDPALVRYIRADIGKLRQVLINLLGNAVNFTAKGSFSLSARSLPEAHSPARCTLQLDVADSGPGIPEAQIERIFEPFFQIDETRTSPKGTGLGLAISKSFIELMNGRISVESKSGEGARFSVELPVSLAEAADVSSLEVDKTLVAGLEAGQPEWRILIAEDNIENRLLLGGILEEAGFKTRNAANGEEAIAHFKEWHPHLIWMDMRMPVMDGFKATAAIRSLPEGDKVKIIAITAGALKEQRKKIMEAGCDHVVYKPFKSHEIFDAMAEHLGVRYIYEERPQVEKAEPEITLTSEMLAELPEELRQALGEAAHNLDISDVNDVIDRIGNKQPDIAGGLLLLVKEFRFEKILELLGGKQ
ncbi:MAG: transporter substrate-binding domain-containing protein [Deltaproteobacteria bacterium]|nr:transporter substrate-binding domain-containing protein [Deltaproteobacteria bacterium]